MMLQFPYLISNLVMLAIHKEGLEPALTKLRSEETVIMND